MSDTADGRVHYSWILVAVLTTALVVVLGAVAFNYARGPGKATMTPEQEREKIIDFVEQCIWDEVAPFRKPEEKPYESKLRRTSRQALADEARDWPLDKLRQHAADRWGYRPAP